MRDAEPPTRWRIRGPGFHAGNLRMPYLRIRVELTAAIATASASLTPSLLPKTTLVQGVVTGIAAALGYGLGALLHWALRPVLRRRVPVPVRDRLGWLLLGVAVVSLIPAAWLSHVWQSELAASIGMPRPAPTHSLFALLIAAAVVAVVVIASRGIRAAVLWGAQQLSRWLPWWVALVVAVALMAGLITGFTQEVVRHRMLESVDQSFKVINEERTGAPAPPRDPVFSGGPGSLIDWSSMGRAGRRFVSLPLPPKPATTPVRVYAGIDSAPGLGTRADLAVADLERAGGLRRGVVCVVVPTGTGWVDPDAVTSLERRWAGDTAIVSMQYSYLPSVLSLAVDRLRVDAAARALVGAVVRRWLALPERSRPQLVLYGESLGSRGVEVAMRDVPRAREVVTGVLLVGPLNSNPTWSRLVAHRDPGSPLLAPVVGNGRSVRFWPGPEMPSYHRAGQPWPKPPSGPRTLYLQHPSDPVVWWSPSLLWSEPAWVDERTQVSRAPPLRWRPIVTFWQVSGDAVFSTDVPDGHGHRYGDELPAAWDAIVPRAGR